MVHTMGTSWQEGSGCTHHPNCKARRRLTLMTTTMPLPSWDLVQLSFIGYHCQLSWLWSLWQWQWWGRRWCGIGASCPMIVDRTTMIITRDAFHHPSLPHVLIVPYFFRVDLEKLVGKTVVGTSSHKNLAGMSVIVFYVSNMEPSGQHVGDISS